MINQLWRNIGLVLFISWACIAQAQDDSSRTSTPKHINQTPTSKVSTDADALIQRLKPLANATPGPDASDEYARLLGMLQLAIGKYGKAYFSLKDIDQTNRDPFVDAMLYEVFAKLKMDDEANLALGRLHNKLTSDQRLLLRNLTFCKTIKFYGVYEPFAVAEFRPNQRVLVYCEVENFNAKREDKEWRIHLDVGLQVSTEMGQVLLDKPKFDTVRFHSRSLNRDLWLVNAINIPDNVKPGSRYRLTLTVTDRQADTTHSQSILFRAK